MNRLALACVALLCAPSFAQVKYSPDPRFQTDEGAGFAYFFGSFAAGRYQMADGNLRNGATVVTRISYRYDNRVYDDFTGMGRTFSNVTLDLSDCNLATMTTNLSANATSTPTRAFSGSVTWPTLSGQQSSSGWPITFPCTPWVANGRADVLADYQFTGGKLANNATWGGGLTKGTLYYLDGYRVGSFANGLARYHYAGTTCLDSGTTRPINNPYAFLSIATYGPTFRTVSYRNKFRVQLRSYYTAANSTAIHLLDALGSPSGVSFPGITCAKLHVAATPLMLVMPQTTDSNGISAPNYLGAPAPGLVPFNAAAVGVTLWTQAAWNDSGTGRLKLTVGSSVKIPGLPAYMVNADAKRLAYSEPAGGRVARGDFYYYNPIAKYN